MGTIAWSLQARELTVVRTKPRIVFIGFDSREMAAYQVARKTVKANLPGVMIRPIILNDLQNAGLYTRPTSTVNGKLFDDLSNAHMSTEFANARFLTHYLAKTKFPRVNRRTMQPLDHQGWALFMDCDMMIRKSLVPVFEIAEANPARAMFCVQHEYEPDNSVKMDGQVQQKYFRKNWSSFMLFNLDHESNTRLTLNLINSVPGRDLHRFGWLEDYEIGALHQEWNWLDGHSPTSIDPAVVHWTLGGPWMSGYENVPYADEWMEAMLF